MQGTADERMFWELGWVSSHCNVHGMSLEGASLHRDCHYPCPFLDDPQLRGAHFFALGLRDAC